MRFSTRAIHVGQEADPTTGATIVPIYQTSTYTQQGIGRHKGYEYARTGNPTRTALQECLAALENAKHGLCFASGLAATQNVLTLLSAGDHVICGDDVYGGTYRLFQLVMTRYGLSFTFMDMSDPVRVAAAVKSNTRLIWLETPTNPMLTLFDIRAIANVAKSRNILCCVDNTFASPYLQNPLELGADIVVHSTTKYLGGHSDVVGGAVLTRDDKLHETMKYHQNAVGGVPGPFDCWLVLRGCKTLAVRMRQHCENADKVARWLKANPLVESVRYPGLPDHPQHELAKRQMRGFGGMVSFVLCGGAEAAQRMLGRTRLFSLAESLGGVESLIGHPATMTHASIPREEREARGVTDGLIRLSVGLEDADDLIADLEQAMQPATQTTRVSVSAQA
ncbi:MAG: cystathionine gamma-synthase [Phycisphaerae bacterium]